MNLTSEFSKFTGSLVRFMLIFIKTLKAQQQIESRWVTMPQEETAAQYSIRELFIREEEAICVNCHF
jgi:hypothetical protein